MNTLRTKILRILQEALEHPATIFSTCACILLIAFLQYISRHVFIDADAFYHGRITSFTPLLHSAGTFPWLQNTTLLRTYADQHYLFHILLKPFASIEGLHFATALFTSVSILAFLYALRSYKVTWKPLWLILYVAGSATFLLRLNLVKAVPLFSALLFMVLCFLIQKRTWLILLMAFIAVWLYGGFILLPIFGASYSLFVFLYTKKLEYKPFLYMCAGIALGVLLHPYRLTLPGFLWQQIVQSGLQLHGAVEQGYEWLPYTIARDSAQDILILVPWVFTLFVATKNLVHKKFEPQTAIFVSWLGALSVCTFLVMLRSGRYIEYWEPLAVLFSGFTLTTLYSQTASTINLATINRWSAFRKAAYMLAVLCAAALLAKNITQTFLVLKYGTPAEAFKPAADWLRDNSPKASTVWNTQWDEFPQLFYWNQHNTYIVGLDPMFMYLHNKDEYLFYKSVAKETTLEPTIIHDTLVRVFHTQYIFLENSRNKNLKHTLDTAPEYFSLRYEDNTTSVYELLP